MADIDVVKKGSRAWLWILMLVILAVILGYAMAGSRPATPGASNMGGQPHSAAAFTSLT